MKTSNLLAKLTSLRLAPPPVLAIALLAALSAPAIFAQDAGGNSLLTGSYRFRYVATLNYNQTTGAVSETLASEGVITFDGAGNYALAAGSQYLDNTVKGGAFQTIPTGTTGTYVINSAGLGYITNPLLSGEYIFGSLTDGVFTGSTTESGEALNDLFIAILPGTPPTNSSFTSPYWIGALDFAIGTDADLKNAMFEITPNGSGGLGSITVQGQANSQGQTALTQTISGGTYNFAADGNAQLSLPAPSGASAPAIMVSGSRTMYISADGNYVLGWNPAGYDILFGVKALTVSGTDSLYSGLYYVSGLSDTPPVSGQPQCSTQSFWGSYSADGMQDEVEHQRLWSPFCSNGGATDYATDNYTGLHQRGTDRRRRIRWATCWCSALAARVSSLFPTASEILASQSASILPATLRIECLSESGRRGQRRELGPDHGWRRAGGTDYAVWLRLGGHHWSSAPAASPSPPCLATCRS